MKTKYVVYIKNGNYLFFIGIYDKKPLLKSNEICE